MSLKGPFLSGVQEKMRMHGYSVEWKKLSVLDQGIHSLSPQTSPRNNGNGVEPAGTTSPLDTL